MFNKFVISKTPYRVSFFGGGTDFPEWFTNNDGMVISTTINKYSYLIMSSDEGLNHKYKIKYYERENVNSLNKIKHPVIKKALKYFKNIKNLHLSHHGDLPAQTGIGSSSAFTVGLINSLNYLSRKKLTKKELAFKSINFERKILKEFVGYQDAMASSFGGFNKIEFKKKTKIQNLNKYHIFKNELEKWCQLFYLGSQRNSQNLEKKKFRNFKKKEKILQKIFDCAKKASLLIQENKKKNITQFAKLLDESWKNKKKIHPLVSTTFVDKKYDIAIRSGSLGGKIIGAGNSGFLLVLTPPSKQKKVTKLINLKEIKIKFENFGSEIFFLKNKNGL